MAALSPLDQKHLSATTDVTDTAMAIVAGVLEPFSNVPIVGVWYCVVPLYVAHGRDPGAPAAWYVGATPTAIVLPEPVSSGHAAAFAIAAPSATSIDDARTAST